MLWQVIRRTGTTATRRPTWKLSPWSGCRPTCRRWTCSKLVRVLFPALLDARQRERSHTSVVWCDVVPVPEPCLDSFVFLRVKETQENILVEPETDDQRWGSSQCPFEMCSQLPLGGSVAIFRLAVVMFCKDPSMTDVYLLYVREYVVDLDEGSQHLMRYRTIAPLVSSGAVHLIWLQM